MPGDDGQLGRMFRNIGEYFARCASSSPGGSSVKLGTVRAAVMPAIPHASIVNCVTYADAPVLGERIDELDALYRDAGVHAWSVWTHESDQAARTTLAQAGFTLDSGPMSMALDLDDPIAPPAELDWTPEPDAGEFANVVEPSYGFPRGVFAAGFPGLPGGVHCYLARHEGRPASVVMASDLEGDCGIFLVGTIPEARGRGLSTALMRRALADATERGCRTSTLQASAMGYPVYRRLGYRDLGRAELWDRRGF
ncbi:MAG: GNAT family N-acetyltransferase [Gaiellaceae bacterium]